MSLRGTKAPSLSAGGGQRWGNLMLREEPHPREAQGLRGGVSPKTPWPALRPPAVRASSHGTHRRREGRGAPAWRPLPAGRAPESSGQEGPWVTPKWTGCPGRPGVGGPSPLGWLRSLSLWAARQSGRWKRPRGRPLSSLSEDGMDRLLSSSKDRSLSESESAPGVGGQRWEAQRCRGEKRDLGSPGVAPAGRKGLGVWGLGEGEGQKGGGAEGWALLGEQGWVLGAC